MTHNNNCQKDKESLSPFRDSIRSIKTDQFVHTKEVKGRDVRNCTYIRLSSKGVSYVEVDFSYSIFDRCYFRNSRFEDCDFTGCQFIATNLHNATFSNCKFDYAEFERTDIDDNILTTNTPAFENVKGRFARSLRKNYEQLGMIDSARRAMRLELKATRTHLRKVWSGEEGYYRKKYGILSRVSHFFQWLNFNSSHFIWGNGESIGRLLRSFLIFIAVVALIDNLIKNGFTRDLLVPQGFIDGFAIAFGALRPLAWPPSALALVTAIRLLLFSFLVTLLVKRFSRR